MCVSCFNIKKPKKNQQHQGECADPTVNIRVAETIVHENYEPESILQANDIALIRLARPVSFTDYIRPICLPIAKNLQNKDYNNDNIAMLVAGYGAGYNNGNFTVIFIHQNDVSPTHFLQYQLIIVYYILLSSIRTKQFAKSVGS